MGPKFFVCPGQGARLLPSPMDHGEDLPKAVVKESPGNL